jgi:hypothetical protein
VCVRVRVWCQQVDDWVNKRKKMLKKKGCMDKKAIQKEISRLQMEARQLVGRATDVEIASTRLTQPILTCTHLTLHQHRLHYN